MKSEWVKIEAFHLSEGFADLIVYKDPDTELWYWKDITPWGEGGSGSDFDSAEAAMEAAEKRSSW